jgi:hypothetical protein
MGFHQALGPLMVEPTLAFIHQRRALRLMGSPTRRGTQPLLARLVIMVEHLCEGRDDHPACAWQARCKPAARSLHWRRPGAKQWQRLTTPSATSLRANASAIAQGGSRSAARGSNNAASFSPA